MYGIRYGTNTDTAIIFVHTVTSTRIVKQYEQIWLQCQYLLRILPHILKRVLFECVAVSVCSLLRFAFFFTMHESIPPSWSRSRTVSHHGVLYIQTSIMCAQCVGVDQSLSHVNRGSNRTIRHQPDMFDDYSFTYICYRSKTIDKWTAHHQQISSRLTWLDNLS
jgi:hypothetical protein